MNDIIKMDNYHFFYCAITVYHIPERFLLIVDNLNKSSYQCFFNAAIQFLVSFPVEIIFLNEKKKADPASTISGISYHNIMFSPKSDASEQTKKSNKMARCITYFTMFLELLLIKTKNMQIWCFVISRLEGVQYCLTF